MFSVAVLLLGLCPVFTIAESTTAAVMHDCHASLNISASLLNAVDRRLLFYRSGSVYRPRPPRSRSGAVVLLLLLSAGVERNPGPKSWLNFAVLNSRSATHKAAHIHDVIADLRLDVLALTETWITSDAPDAVKLDI